MTGKNVTGIVLISVLLILTSFVTSGRSQGSYPERPITLVVGFGAGGFTDLSARALGKAAEKELGQPVIVENKPGAGAVIGTAFAAKQKPDGYTLGVTGTSQYILTPNIRQTPYDPLTDMTDILTYVDMPFAFVVKTDAPWNTYDELIAHVKANPGKFTYATAGVGLAQHICMERIGSKDGLKWTHVPFKSGAEAATATLGGHTQGMASTLPDVFPHVKAGKLRMLLVLSGSRLPDFPNVPTILEKGYGFDTFSSLGVFGPKGLPEPIRQKLETAFKNAMKDPVFIETLKQIGATPNFVSGSEYSAKWRSQYQEMGRVLKALGIVEK